ncbi:MAG: sulfite exporter TauE/SafE family protein [Phycisphaerales bacterium JB039]
MLEFSDILIATLIGLAAGLLGGLAGVGGSMVMIPGLALTLRDPDPGSAQHVYMGAAMMVNIIVALPAAVRHHKAGAVRFDAVRIILPVMMVTIIAGVLVSNRIHGERLRQFLAIFIAGYSVYTILRLLRKHPEPTAAHERVTGGRLGAIGGITGLIAGLLGIGGGVLMVPMLQVFCRLPIRNAIAVSSAVMVMSAVIGASLKVATLGPEHGRSALEAFWLAAAMAPTAFVGAWMGASLTHRLPLVAVKLAVAALLLVVAAKLAGVGG